MLLDAVCVIAAIAPVFRDVRVALLGAALLIALNAVRRLYRLRLTLSVLDDCPAIASCGIVACVLAGLPAGMGTGAMVGAALGSAALYVGLASCCRGAVYALVRRARVRGWLVPALVVGRERLARSITTVLSSHPEHGLMPVGLADTPADTTSDTTSGTPPDMPPDATSDATSDPLADALAETIRVFGVQVVILTSVPALEATVRLMRVAGCEVYLAPEPGRMLTRLLPGRDHVRCFPMVRVEVQPRARVSRLVKRWMDMALAATGLVVAAPVFAVCAAVVWLEGGPGVFFRQVRVGLAGRHFEVFKFRTLRPSDESESATLWNIGTDERVGRAGRILRKTSLDELPQLWNVLRGDMSLVGPRPERPHFVDQFSATFPHYRARHRFPAGITGWAQVHGLRGDTSIEDRARFDNYYIDTWSLWTDVKILLRTAGTAIRPGGR